MFKFQDINAGYIDYSDEELGGDALDSDNDNIDDDNDIGLNDDDNDNDNHDEVKERFSNDRQIPTSSTHKQQEKTQQRLSSQSLAEMKRLADMITTFKLEQKSFKQKTQEELETKKLNELKQKRQTAWDVKVYSEDLKRASHDTTTTMTTIPSYSNSNNSDLDNSITMNDLLPGVVEKYEKEQQRIREEVEYYDDSYFDSDPESDSDTEQQPENTAPFHPTEPKKPKISKKPKKPIISNDELLYDDNLDDEDERWMNEQRQMYRHGRPKKDATTSTSDTTTPTIADNSDAILSCPFCFTTLCIDCQRHETYVDQFRAMFVLNCTIGKRSQSQPQSQPHSTEFTTGKANKKSGNWAKRQQKQNRFNNNKNNNNIEVLSTVKCTVCSTEVGVLDSDDIYHFFNVLSSAS